MLENATALLKTEKHISMMSDIIIYFRTLWGKWGIKAATSIIDQCFFSGVNFIFYIYLARYFSPVGYGIFAIAFSIFLFLSSLHQAFILEPMTVIGSNDYSKKLPVYLGGMFWIHFILTILLSLITAVIAGIIFLVKKDILAASFLGLACASPLILFFWLFRQVCYLKTLPELALKGSICYALLLFLLLILTKKLNLISPFNALFIMGLAGSVAAIIYWSRLEVKLYFSNLDDFKNTLAEIWKRNWNYAKWGLGSIFTNWLSTVVYLPLVGIFMGFSQAAVFRAMQNITLPLQRVFSASGLLFLPVLSRQLVSSGKHKLNNSVGRLIIFDVAIACGYAIIIVFLGKSLVKFIYGQSIYTDFFWLLSYLCLASIVEAVSHGLYLGLKASERMYPVFLAQVAGVIATLSVGLYLVRKFQLLGAALGAIFTIVCITAVLGCFFWNDHSK